MDFTRVDLTIKGMKETLNGVVDVHFVSHGRWKIDEESGKTLCRIEVKIPQKGITFNFIPSDNFCEELVDKMFQADLENDTYKYKKPKIAPTRPAQLGGKIERLSKILEKWRVRAKAIAQLKAGSELEQLQTSWKQVIEQAPEDTKRTPVIAILRSAGTKPVAIEGDTVVLAFRYPIHKEKVEMTENRQVAERIITHFLGHSCQVRCIYEPENAHLVQAALKMGAQIIDVEE